MGCGSSRVAGSSYVMETQTEPSLKYSEIPLAGGSGKGKGGVRVCQGHPWIMKAGAIASGDCANIADVCVLGVGLMGTVRLSKWTSGKISLYIAVKGINKDYILKHHDERHIENEKKIMQICNSPFIIRLFGTFQDDDCIYFNMEYAMGGELFGFIRSGRRFPVEMARFFAAEIFLALEHVQKHGFVYRDLKPENVMLDEAGHCKLVDFGFATQPNQKGLCTTNCGTPAYLSPEQLNLKFTKGYTKAVDWWSLGCLIFELMAGLTPFNKSPTDSEYEVYTRVQSGSMSFPGGFDATAKEFIKALLQRELSERLVDPKAIRKHPFFEYKNCRWEDVEKKKVRPPIVPDVTGEGDASHFDAQKDFKPRKSFKPGGSMAQAGVFKGF